MKISAFLSQRIWWHLPHFTWRWLQGIAKTGGSSAITFARFLKTLSKAPKARGGGRVLRGALGRLPEPVIRFDGLFGAERILALFPHRRHGPVVHVRPSAQHILLHLNLCLLIFSRLEQRLSTSGPQLSLDFVKIQL